MKISMFKVVRNVFFCFFLVTIYSDISVCQKTCKPEIIHFRRQSQVDSFPIIFKGCDYIDTTIFIWRSGIFNLDSVYFIKRFNRLIIKDTYIENLDGLNGLDSVGALEIFGNKSLKNLQGLKNLKKAYYISIGVHDSIRTLHGLNLDSLFGQISLSTLGASSDIAKLKNLAGLKANFIEKLILGNKHLEDLSGSDIKYLKWLKITPKNTLNKLADLNPLEVIKIGMSNSISDISELNELLKIPGYDLKQLRLTHLPNLQNCAIEYICQNIDKGGFLYLENLGSGCNSIAEIKAACLVSSQNVPDDIWAVSPNPVADELVFMTQTQLPDIGEVEIINAQSVLMKSLSLKYYDQKIKGDVSQWVSGIYFYRIFDKHKKLLGKGKFVKL